MKHLITVCAIMLFVVMPNWIVVQAEEPAYLLVRVDISYARDIVPLQRLGLDIVDGARGEYIEVVCHSAALSDILALGYSTHVLIDDMVRYYQERSGTDDMGGYHTWSEMVTEINQVHTDHPDITTAPFSIGQTIEGREMYVIKISDNPEVDENEPEAFFNALTHAREPIGVEICLGLIHRLTEDYGSDPYITDLVDNREIFVLPVFNVDGYVYNEQTNPTGGGMWRKNRRHNSGGSYGVDLNRNFSFDWGYNNYGSSPNQSSETYRGTAPFSEPENENVRQFCNQRNFAMNLNIHSYSNLMMYAWSGPHRGFTPEEDLFQALTATMFQWNGYNFGTGWQVLYEMNGEANDWMYGEQNEKPRIMSWLFEVGSNFWPPASQIPALVNANIDPCLYMIEQAADYMSPRVTLTPLNPPVQVPATGGDIEFNIASAHNHFDPITCDIWCDVTLPSGSIFGPIMGPAEFTTPVGDGVDRDRQLTVPASAPAGNYTYNAYLGHYPDVTWHKASFEFEKLTDIVGIVGEGEWLESGESFEDPEVNDLVLVPTEMILHSCSPNPFNPSTVLSYKLQAANKVNLSVYDISGKRVTELVDGWWDAGLHEVTFDASNLASGIYLYRLVAGDFSTTGKMTYLK